MKSNANRVALMGLFVVAATACPQGRLPRDIDPASMEDDNNDGDMDTDQDVDTRCDTSADADGGMGGSVASCDPKCYPSCEPMCDSDCDPSCDPNCVPPVDDGGMGDGMSTSSDIGMHGGIDP